MAKQKARLDPEEALRRAAQFITELYARGNALDSQDDNVLIAARGGECLVRRAERSDALV